MDQAVTTFEALTPLQRQVLDAGGWRLGAGKQPSRGTTKRLVQLGLLTEHPRRFMNANVTEYAVPAEVQAAWAAHKGKSS